MMLRDDLEIELGGFYGPSGKKVSIGVLRRSARKVLPRFPDLLEPAIHEAVIRLHTLPEADAVGNPDAFGAWVAHNTAVDLRSKELRQRDIVSALTREDILVFGYSIKALARKDLLRRFLLVLKSTPMGARRRRVLILALQGIGAEEIAETLKISVRTVYNDLTAIKKLIENLDPTDPPRSE